MINRYIRAIAGTFVIISVLLGMYVNENWLWFTIFVGVNLLQSSITKWCLMEDILRKVGIKDSKESCN
ncbi:DUF2892 domain-containing protein [Winogradskyella sp. SYSU M77433]|uniref:YgaP family membrane protein n=1 Tax=Winogradskyella sp. SYSU M77433 TaxID=3042722 RepID=UPI0024812204|nr:DUF2892 domain-containing protein [Winogradskyella sp. SYSU M77433]MDH7912752.1 DUF2892 domain-containing protein [Winogradskyella sp. SYSU M77433]